MLKARLLTALVLLSFFLLALFFLPPNGWVFFAAFAAAAGCREWARLCRISPSIVNAFSVLTFTTVLAFVLLLPGKLLLWIACAFWLLAAPLWLRFKWPLHGVPGTLLGVVLLSAAAVAMIRLRELSPVVLLAVMVLVWVADSAAYFCGRAFGRHKLAPHISPGKTWEGAAGALVGVMLVGFLLNQAALAQGLPALHQNWLLPQLILITAVSIVGDLFESMMKRAAGIKDSGTLLPGHGGLLDRIDSLLPALPIGVVLLGLNDAIALGVSK